MTYQWLFFDADNTLFDYAQAEASALENTFRNFNLAFAEDTGLLYNEVNGRLWRELEAGTITSQALRVQRFEQLFQALSISADAQAFSKRYLVNLGLSSQLLPEAEQTVRALAGQYQLAIITNGFTEVQRARLDASPIGKLFSVVAISEEIGAAKPDPLFFERVFAQIGNPSKASVLVIGDSLTSDILGGLNYQLDTCWFNPMDKPANPQIPATYTIHRLSELLKLLE